MAQAECGMRWSVVLLAACGAAANVLGQTGWSPVSREVERPFATVLQAYGSDAHTAIRPYAIGTLKATNMPDSLQPSSVLPKLDTWAGRLNGRKFRWGPLLEATGGYGSGTTSGTLYRTGGGFWADLDAGAKVNFHLDAFAISERLPGYLDTLARATQVTPGEGYAYGSSPDVTHYDWNGHVSWDAHKYINLTLGRGKNFFGEGYRSLFLSDEAYSYPYLRLSTTVWKIKYVNLFSMMNDIRGAKGVPSEYGRKFSSMHYLSWNASKRINLAVFEGIIWSTGDEDYPRGFDLNYLNPVIFYRPVEYRIGSPDNALLGLGLNIKAGKHVLFYGQLMLDELLMDQVQRGDGWYANKQAFQIGVNAYEAFGVAGLQLRGEWNFIRPFMYTHSDTRQNYAHMGQPLAHPYGSNLQEAVAQGDLVRDRWVYAAHFSMAWMGSDNEFSYGNNIFRPESDRPKLPDNKPDDFGYRIGKLHQINLFHAELRAGWTVDPRSATRLEAAYTFRVRTPSEGDGTVTNYLRLGLVCHFRDRHPEQEVRYELK
ncbi:MAG: hypothetical protein JNL43_07475 [Flavobacteriales bacterium]|nr:hypothetical protein [Flavobacteriales bacterium]